MYFFLLATKNEVRTKYGRHYLMHFIFFDRGNCRVYKNFLPFSFVCSSKRFVY